jgi:hypothetical protein
MRTSRLLLLIAASVLAIPLAAQAQQVASQFTCAIPMDGGTGTVTNTCGPVLLDYQPFTVNCQLGPNYETSQGVISILTSGDGSHFGGPTSLVVVALPDGGLGTLNGQNAANTSAWGPTGNASGTATVVAATDIFDVAVNPTDPYLYAKVSATFKADGGTSDAINCYFSVVQAQTLHSPHNFKGATVKSTGVKVTK